MDGVGGLASMDVMATRLYDSAWVRIEGSEQPLQVRRDRRNAGTFHIGGHAYDIDGRPLQPSDIAPAIVTVLSLQAVRDAGLLTTYIGDMRRVRAT